MKPFRFRNIFLILGSLIVLVYLYASDPNPGVGPLIVFIGTLATPVIAVAFAHLARKALFDYMDMGQVFRKAKETATGAGLVFLGVCIVVFGLLGLFGNKVSAQEVQTYVPPAALIHIPVLKQEIATHHSKHPKPTSLQV